jgi:tetratricopeptide (TPR) repeat protein
MLERGEQEKAERILAKARALQGRPSWTAASGPGADLETEDDLIAFAERQERRAQGSLNPRYVLLVVVGLAVLVLIVGGIAFITSPHKAASPSEGSAPDSDPAADTALPSAGSVPDTSLPPRDSAADAVTEQQAVSPAVDEEPSVMDVAEAASPAVPLPPAELPPPRAKAAKPKAKAPPRKASSSARESASEEPTTRGPSADVVQAELASMNPKQLTARADALYQEGHTGIAASYYRHALELDPDYAPALVGVGQGTLRAKRYPEAMRNATRALQLARGVDARPGLEAEAIYQMGRVHYERGERDAARRLFRQSISLPGTPSEAWFYLGEALSSDNSPAAREAYEQYLVLVPKGHLADRARRAIQ